MVQLTQAEGSKMWDHEPRSTTESGLVRSRGSHRHHMGLYGVGEIVKREDEDHRTGICGNGNQKEETMSFC
ncbi:Hypothetical predicted protein [Olea europaea subsp. europaea]|uniref:Uncharacterized protein n=1 Tax=Olea europaea subsp. europaea TaxID=158383 RepID=A0A8S0PUK7_OLEEU|nr:Hypothetical predicted protein [Olea europaea subsp. europaea]